MRGTRSKSVTPVIAHSPMERFSDKVMLRDLLTGTCSKEALRLCRTEDLEQLLFKILSMQSTNSPEMDTNLKPPWWLDDVLPFADLQNVQRQVHNVIEKWHLSLSAVLDSYVKYHQKSPKPLRTGRPSMESAGTSSSLATPRKRLRMTSDDLDYVMSPVVRLTDVLLSKYPVLEKDDFMNFLKLQPTDSHPPTPVKVSTRDLRFKYSCNMPFSSMYGKIAIANGRHAYSEESYQRRRNWTNRYLKNAKNIEASRKYEVTYKPKKGVSECKRKYTFPRRQFRQRRNARKVLAKAFVKPVTVNLNRLNIQPYLLKLKMCRHVTVNIDKTETDKVTSSLQDFQTYSSKKY